MNVSEGGALAQPLATTIAATAMARVAAARDRRTQTALSNEQCHGCLLRWQRGHHRRKAPRAAHDDCLSVASRFAKTSLKSITSDCVRTGTTRRLGTYGRSAATAIPLRRPHARRWAVPRVARRATDPTEQAHVRAIARPRRSRAESRHPRPARATRLGNAAHRDARESLAAVDDASPSHRRSRGSAALHRGRAGAGLSFDTGGRRRGRAGLERRNGDRVHDSAGCRVGPRIPRTLAPSLAERWVTLPPLSSSLSASGSAHSSYSRTQL